MQIPTNWRDDGTTLMAPNGQQVSGAFRDYILSHPWESADMPLGPAQNADPVELGWRPQSGSSAGTRLICMYSELCYTAQRGVYRASVGREFWTLLNQQQSAQPVLPPNAPAPSDAIRNTPANTMIRSAEAANRVLLQDLKAAAKLIGDTSTHMLVQLDTIQ